MTSVRLSTAIKVFVTQSPNYSLLTPMMKAVKVIVTCLFTTHHLQDQYLAFSLSKALSQP